VTRHRVRKPVLVGHRGSADGQVGSGGGSGDGVAGDGQLSLISAFPQVGVWALKDQVGLERRGGRVPAGLRARIVRRLVAKNAELADRRPDQTLLIACDRLSMSCRCFAGR
jgi:hypothetical protein